MGIIEGGKVIEKAGQRVLTEVIGWAAQAAGAILAAVTDTGSQQVITTGINQPPQPMRIGATAGGTAGDIKAIQVTIAGTDPLDNSISEALPAFTENTAGQVVGRKVFKTVTSITIPAHDGTGATTSVEGMGAPAAADADGLMLALTDDGAEAVVVAGDDLFQPEVARNITATAGGTAGDIGAIQVVVAGKNCLGQSITETLPAFTVDTPGTVAGAKAFAEITQVTIPAHDGTGATTSIGFGDILGLNHIIDRNTVLAAFLAETIEGTAPTVVADNNEIEKNTVDLNSALDGTQVKVQFVPTSPGN